MSRLIHANFTNKDTWATFTYDPENNPDDLSAAQRDMKNYCRRLRRYIKKHGLQDLKYLYVTERVVNETTGKIHTHHHIIMNFRDRDMAEALWTSGRTQTRRLQPDDYGLEGLARYISKPETKDGNRNGAKTYATSLNLEKPKINKSDHRLPMTNYKLSKKRVAEMAVNENTAIKTIEECYTGYKLVEDFKSGNKIITKYSDYSAGAYIYARLMKKRAAL